ncbi:hypothetical protein [Tateyamaria sp. Alg231-49]|uniref:hypothetical protein n=1 Tax=Tateyamaria sp. Alg231-49 TaxID=1922219 RepID=UPI001F24088A|nr:hypothetical protein [Tateyamaria sp. Alg231-49]
MGAALVAMCFSFGAHAQDTKPVEDITLSDIRGMRFCEFLLVFEDRVDIYNTSASPGCPEEQFAAADPVAIAKAFGAKVAQVNGPKFWAMDEQTLGLGETQTFAGIEARYAASLPLASLGSGKGSDPYKPYVTHKSQNITFMADRPVYELTGPDGKSYVLNAYGAKVKDGDPANLSEQLNLSQGWNFGVRTPENNLIVIQRIETPSNMVGDDMEQYYSLVVSQ